jgi:hypothetical protein
MYKFLFINLILRTQVWVLVLSLSCSLTSGATAKRRRPSAHLSAPRVTSLLPGIVRGGPWTEPTYADSTDGDSAAGEELSIRRIAVQALGRYNGSVVAVDPSTGRILSIVNQRLALGFQRKGKNSSGFHSRSRMS